jgi:predicted small lipoprotein YifL
MRIVAAITLLLSLLVGCGQTGPLYLPGEAPTPQASTPLPSEPAAGSEPGTSPEN